MGSIYLYFFILMHFLFFLSCSNFTKLAHSLSSLQQMCHDDESSALLQFKQSFIIRKYPSQLCSFAYPKVLSWSPEGENANCCSWDGVECDNHTGHVIGLDLSCSFLYGSINSNSTLFKLVHLQSLNLAANDFNYSQIPSGIRNLSKLKSLNLSGSSFFGQIPSELIELTNLVFLDLSLNVDPLYSQSLLNLENPSLSNLVENLTNLQVLLLGYVNISSTVPETIANLSSLSTLGLAESGLFGNFPNSVFSLPNLRFLSVGFNPNLIGSLPEFHRGSLLELLALTGTSFTGKLPDSIENLDHLNVLDIRNCNFSGPIPSSVGNLINLSYVDLSRNYFTGQIPSSLANLTQLNFLSLGYNNFSSGTLSWIGKQTKLIDLQLPLNNLDGVIPCSLQNMTQLTYLELGGNQLTGDIPSCLGNLTQLNVLHLQQNELHGPIPLSILKLTNLTSLHLEQNELSGTMEVEMFLMLKNLNDLDLTGNKLSLFTTGSINGTLPKFKLLELGRCNLSEFPKFLQYQDQMVFLGLSYNNLHGHIPKWIWNIGKKTLMALSLFSNFLTGFEQPRHVLPWDGLMELDLSRNLLQGSLPIPPFTTVIYSVSNNLLTGDIPSLICNLSSLFFLGLADNKLNGTIPRCLSNFSDSLTVMLLQNNNLHGTIPQAYNKGSNLKLIDLSLNHLDGPIPRSLANCKMLEYLNLENNQINDIFPLWLGMIPEMKILALRSNKLHGKIEGPLSKFDFPKLHIIDISLNGFSGELPLEYFQIWSVLKVQEDKVKLKYAETILVQLRIWKYYLYGGYSHSMRITNKGAEMLYDKIQNGFKAIDFSGNKFAGNIPESIGVLKGLHLLNLSNNALTGPIPTSLGNLTALESLDLSQNELSGDIPQQLVQLTFLEVFNVSHNHLVGPIPKGKQFDTFGDSSFDGNSGLCGKPLSKKCGNSVQLPSPTLAIEDDDSGFPTKLDWIIRSLGYLSGTVVGVVVGHILTTRYHVWFVRKFEKLPKWKRAKKGGRRN